MFRAESPKFFKASSAVLILLIAFFREMCYSNRK